MVEFTMENIQVFGEQYSLDHPWEWWSLLWRIFRCSGSSTLSLEDTIGNHFADMVGVLRAVQHGEYRVKRVAQQFGTAVVENGA